MNTRRLDPNVLFIVLPAEPQLRPELALIRENVARTGGLHLVLDLSRVELITSPSIGGLLLTRKLLAEQGRRLVLCNIRLATKCILRVAGLDTFFEYARDKFEARDALRQSEGSASQQVRAFD
ncbi:MAG: STAS domain-containing protein [Sedimentisphaerales bacterium]|nr:STAS domain-containing protein [Sedimentisphaerales bacterium]